MPKLNFCPTCGNSLETALLNERERLVCSVRCGYVHWDNPIPVVGAIVEYDNDTVILIQNKGW